VVDVVDVEVSVHEAEGGREAVEVGRVRFFRVGVFLPLY
jgi:hypothetical protein